jgi:Tol biopolymer transport system component
LKTGESEMLVPRGRTPRLSPDGRWLAYRTTESGISEIYVSPFPDVGRARWQVSTGGSSAPRWSRDSTELYYRGLGSNRSHLYVLKMGTAATLEGARPQVLVEVPDSGSNTLEEFDVARDGRFLVLKALPQQPPIPHVIVNWFEVLKQTVPTSGQSSK